MLRSFDFKLLIKEQVLLPQIQKHEAFHNHHLPSPPTPRPPNSIKTFYLSPPPRLSHHLSIARVPRQIKPDHNNQICQHENTPFEIIAFALAIHVAQEENAQDHSHHVELREDEVEGVVSESRRVDVGGVHGGEEDEGGDLQEADLEGVGGADFHREGDVAVHGEGDGVLLFETLAIWCCLRGGRCDGEESAGVAGWTYQEFGRVRHQGKQRDSQKLFVDVDAFKDYIYGIH